MKIDKNLSERKESENTAKEENLILKEADVLLNVISGMRTAKKNENIEKLRDYLISEVQKFEVNCTSHNIEYEKIIGARYCLCSALDEAIMSTSWGQEAVWNQKGLLVTFHNETWGGEKFFELLSRLCKNALKNIDLIEVQTYCLLLGFQGRYHVIENGLGQLDTLKKRLISIIYSIRGKYQANLFDNKCTLYKKPKKNNPPLSIFTAIGLAVVSAAIIYMIYNKALNNITVPVLNEILTLQLPHLKIRNEDYVNKLSLIEKALANEINKNVVTVIRDGNKEIIRLNGDGFFDTGKSQLRKEYVKAINDLADNIADLSGEIIIVGHTDNVPIHNKNYASNFELSLARAKTVEDIFIHRLIRTERIKIIGAGDSQPIATNDTAENRALNRRVEIVLMAPQTNK